MFVYLLSLPFRLVVSLVAAIVGIVALVIEGFTGEGFRKIVCTVLLILGLGYAASTFIEGGRFYDPNFNPYLVIVVLLAVLAFYLVASVVHVTFKQIKKGSFYSAKRVLAMPKPPPPPSHPAPMVEPQPPQVQNQMAVTPQQFEPPAAPINAEPVSIVSRGVATPKTLDAIAGELPPHLRALIGVPEKK